MRWSEVRSLHPDQWLVVEALEAHSEGGRRIPDRLAVVEVCIDGSAAFRRYRRLHQDHPARELYFVHTQNAELEIEERPWIGVRLGDAPRDSE
ncbi:MAG: hypothetical protein ACHQ17_03035 [Polyangia bacterium]|jgi:hypothetical protein